MDGWTVAYEAGQFITLVFQKLNKEDRRSYSFSSTPALNEPLRITVKRVANGEYSRHLFNHVHVGDILSSAGIAGFFRLPDNLSTSKNIFFLAAGSGITPVYSMLKTVLNTSDATVTLVYSNRTINDAIFYKELIHLKERFSNRLDIEFLFSNAVRLKETRLSKVRLNELLEKYKTPLDQTLFYICGPMEYMLMAGITLITAGVPTENIRKENFNTKKHTAKPIPPDTEQHLVTVHINDKKFEFPVQYPDTILSAAKKRNINLPYSCEAGNCGSCSATCTKGKVWMAYNEVLLDNEIARGIVLTCQGYVVDVDAEIRFD